MNTAEVWLWGMQIGAVSWDKHKELASFQYTPEFAESPFELSPIHMPLSTTPYSFSDLDRRTFKGLPGMLADALPDKFGNALIDQWLAEQGREPSSFNPVERLCYIGSRGTGALEFKPVAKDAPKIKPKDLNIQKMVELCSVILSNRENMNANWGSTENEMHEGLSEILVVGTSAGGARAKAVIAWNEKTNEVKSGQVEAGTGFNYWLLKFDGVSSNKDKELADSKGYGRIEYAYHRMAIATGIEMRECRLLEENGRAHFMTRRFDRTNGAEKVFMQSLCALGHYDFNITGATSYEQAMHIGEKLKLGMKAKCYFPNYNRTNPQFSTFLLS